VWRYTVATRNRIVVELRKIHSRTKAGEEDMNDEMIGPAADNQRLNEEEVQRFKADQELKRLPMSEPRFLGEEIDPNSVLRDHKFQAWCDKHHLVRGDWAWEAWTDARLSLESALANLTVQHKAEIAEMEEQTLMRIAEAEDHSNWILCKCVEAVRGKEGGSITGDDFKALAGQISSLKANEEQRLRKAIGFAVRWIGRDGAESAEVLIDEHIAQDLTNQCVAAFLASLEWEDKRPEP
jgi:hypothetical protein